MGDSLPRTPIKRHALFDALSSAQKSVTVQTHKITKTNKQTNSNRYIHTLPLDNKHHQWATQKTDLNKRGLRHRARVRVRVRNSAVQHADRLRAVLFVEFSGSDKPSTNDTRRPRDPVEWTNKAITTHAQYITLIRPSLLIIIHPHVIQRTSATPLQPFRRGETSCPLSPAVSSSAYFLRVRSGVRRRAAAQGELRNARPFQISSIAVRGTHV